MMDPLMPMQPEESQDEGRRGSFNLNVLIALAGLTLAFLLQFGGTIWWGATLAANVVNIKETLVRMDRERYTKWDAARDIQRLDQRSNELTERIRRLEESIYGTSNGRSSTR